MANWYQKQQRKNAAKKPASQKGTHHPKCGDVGETGEHGELGTNAAPAAKKENPGA